MLTSLLCRYRYDALDQLIWREPVGKEKLQRFYRREHLVTELQGPAGQGVFQHDRHLLALHLRRVLRSIASCWALISSDLCYSLSIAVERCIRFMLPMVTDMPIRALEVCWDTTARRSIRSPGITCWAMAIGRSIRC